MHAFRDDFGLPVELTFDPSDYRQNEARHVLIFPFWQGKLLFTRHRTRGIELPGGKIEPGESSLAAAVREVYEETGAVLEGIERIGQYTIDNSMVKDIYVARVLHYTEIPSGTDVAQTILFDTIPTEVKGDPQFSRLLYDDVYPLALAHASVHRFAQPG
ncbi:NUDIX domain-containing protein [Brevibacillus choshinensis]|uniref:NUDIX domain-containing protein n=1 Tax=Brevibacillus choshinensis TaxID=54911 RepID=UPI002E1B312D|nr:NUDIX domain-containing protein [Brevibacillus choshinensis]MED4585966.1 NUDIX domain-containing protein [Brevibacillus choshinensis]MED4752089.1 NUDIX domain-containing protein [Brevibacillus choshinensis]